MIDKDNSGTLTKTEIVKAVAEDKDVVKFCARGEENLQFLLQPARLEKALDVLDTSKDGEVDIDEWEEAIHRGLAKRLEQLADERERRVRLGRGRASSFPWREVFDMIDKDGSGSLDKKEVVTAIRTDKKVISFLQNCGNQNLQYLLVPARLEMALNRWTRTRRRNQRAGREAQAKAARKEIEEFTAEFLNAARQCLQMIDKDNSGTLTKTEIVKAVAEDKDVVKFLRTCGEENLQFLLQPARLEKALDVLDTSKDGEVDIDEWEEAIHRGLAKRLEQLADERERRERAARAEDEAFSAEFLSMAREVFDMIDKDGSGSLDKKEVVTAIRTDKKVISFLQNCGNQNLQYLLVPARLEMALNTLDTDRDGEINAPEWESAIETALANKLEARAAQREAQAKAARKEIEEFTAEFLNAARQCFQMIDKDNSGTLTKTEIVKAVAEDKDVVKFLRTCGEDNLQFLLQPARLEKALQVLDTSKDGEVDIDEWEEAVHRGLAKRLEQLAEERERRDRAARAEDGVQRRVFERREVFIMIDKDDSGSLDKAEVVKAVKTDKKVIDFLVNCGNQNLQYLLVPARLEMALNTLDTDRDGEINMPEWESAIETALANKLEARAADRERKAKAARKEIEEFTAEFLGAARQCFQMIDKDSSGTLTKTEIVKAVAEDKDVVKFLRTCGEENLQFLLVPAPGESAEVLDTSKDGEFLNAAREVFLMIDKDDSGSLDKAEVIKAVKTDKKVINFLVNCGNENLQYLLVPARLEMALNTLDTDRDGEINMPEWESAIETALANKLEARAADREAKAKAAQKEIEEFTSEFLNAARQCCQMIDVDNSGTLTKAEIVEAVQSNETVITFLRTCGEPNLQLLQPRRLQKAPRCSTRPRTARSTPRSGRRPSTGASSQEFLGAARHFQLIDKDDSGTLTKTEIVKAVQTDPEVKGFLETCGEENLQFCWYRRAWRSARSWTRPRTARSASAVGGGHQPGPQVPQRRAVFDMIDVDESGSLDKHEIVTAVQTDQKVIDFLRTCGNENLQYLLVPARLAQALEDLDTSRDGEIDAAEWEAAIETALANKLEARAAQREAQAKAARKEIEEFTAEFLNAARQCFQMIDKDNSGTLTKTEIVKAVAEDKDVVKFLRTRCKCWTPKDGEVDIDEWEEAVHRGLAKRLEQLAEERERRDRAARAEDEAFSAEFLNAAREVFIMIDKDDSGSLDKAEVVKAVKTDKKVIDFLVNCGNQNLQYLLVPARLEMALNTLDTDRDGEINMPEWESAIETALANKLEARAADRERKAKAARKEIEEFTAEFLGAARQCFQMIDKDSSGTLTKTEIVKAVAEDKDVVKFLRTCGEENLQFLLVPARLEKALEVLDTSKDGEVDIDEWEEAIHRGLAKRLEQLAEERERRERAARAEDEAFTAQFLNAAREVFLMIDKDDSGSLDKAEVIKAVKTDKKVINFW
ncbi:Ca2-binding protein [Aureococcus anophagefferens]|nr:Ca2-binding protein [Aureococcus anophagefferens]